MNEPEVWLRGPVPGIPPLLQPVAHALLHCREELTAKLTPLTADQIWRQPPGAASIGYHARHAAGSLDRLFTYARGEQLSEAQRTVLSIEREPDRSLGAPELLAMFDAVVERALQQLGATPEASLITAREVGRAKLPSTVGGILFHAAEHTQRHLGQIATTVKVIGGR
jgi:uncharacterized damage-inducible protein DinB